MELHLIPNKPITTFLTAAEIPPNLPRVKIGEALRVKVARVLLVRDTRNFWRLSGDLERLG